MKFISLVLPPILVLCGFIQSACSCRGTDWAYGTQCIKVIPFTFYGTAAELACANAGSQLLNITTQELFEFISRRLATSMNKTFLVKSTPGTSKPWLENSNTSTCFIYTGDKVKDAPCSGLYDGVICIHDNPHYNPADNCLVGLTEHSFIGEETGNCVYRTATATMREKADETCSIHGGRFLNLDEIMRDGLSAFNEHKVMMNDRWRYWTSMTVNSSGVWWSSGEPLQPFIPFVPGNGTCVTASFTFVETVRTELFQTECRDHAYVICSLTLATSGSEATAPPSPGRQLSCPHGQNWKVYPSTNECYWETSFETSRLSWGEARQFCQAYGGELASFHSQDEERIGLSFQYGSLAHPYWIGLHLDPENGTYKWTDGSPLTYQNWAPGHPNHLDKRLRCVAMDAAAKNWISSLCGIISWFICKAPKRADSSPPVVPKKQELVPCNPQALVSKSFYFKGYCYNVVNVMSSWHRAKEHCDNEESSLASVHSDEEMGFLLKLLYEDKGTRGNRVWIGMNSLGSGILKWSDWSAVDYTYWNVNEPNNHRNQEKCISMYIGNGLWNDENCNNAMGFVCKQNKDANTSTSVPGTADPTVGNCRKGWYAHHDRCYLPVGYTEREYANWTKAAQVCHDFGGYLVSIRDPKEQAFLSYLMQSLKNDTWIGLHDTVQSGRYYWLDNSDIRYSNWAPGEPSFFGIQEDCVKMVYEELDSGVWRDDTCDVKLPYICQMDKDPSLPKPEYSRGLECIFPQGWLKLDDMCFKMFAGNALSWTEAELACNREGARLVSLADTPVQAVAAYLGMEVNQSYWIGLTYNRSSQRFQWQNNWPMTISKWSKNQPTNEEVCYSSTAEGYWGKLSCRAQLPFMCQITAGKPPSLIRYSGECPGSSRDWKPTTGSFCHLYGASPADWFSANIRCFKFGSYLISLHSLEELETVRKTMRSDIKSVFIGLMRNDKDGFMWTDQSPVDFVNWDDGQPLNTEDNCVEMVTDTMKWRVVPCLSRKHFVCSNTKENEIVEIPTSEKYSQGSSSRLSAASVAGIVIGVLLAIPVIGLALWYFRPFQPFHRRVRLTNSLSYENALYNVDASSMEFQDGDMGRRNSR